MSYSGIVVGRILSKDQHSHAHHNEIGWNHIHHIGCGEMSDMAGIYTEGVSPGTRIHHNLIHDVNRLRYGGWGLYCDEASSGILLDHNIIYDCMDGGYMQNPGSGNISPNIVSNNIFVFSTDVEGQIACGKKKVATAKELMSIQRNIIGTLTGQVLERYWFAEDAAQDPGSGFHFDWNLYWKPEDKDIRFKDWSLEQWREMGQDRHSIIADPMFVDAERRDFRLKPDSPALAIGFEQIDTKEIGLYGDPDWVDAPKDVPAQVFRKIEILAPVQKAEPLPPTATDDFETTAVGEQAKGASTYGESANTSIRVTDETAADGKHSLKFIDGPAEKKHWPYLSYRLTKAEIGVAHFSFDLRMGQGAVLSHEWRNKVTDFATGPAIRFGDRAIAVDGKTVASYPIDQWFHVEIICQPGSDFTLIITVPDQDAQVVKKLKCRSGAEFNVLNWLGWMSYGNPSSTFYIDGLKLKFEVNEPM